MHAKNVKNPVGSLPDQNIDNNTSTYSGLWNLEHMYATVSEISAKIGIWRIWKECHTFLFVNIFPNAKNVLKLWFSKSV